MNETPALLQGAAGAERPPTWGTFRPGAYADMEAEEYFATEAMSSSGADKILRSPMHYKLDRTEHSEPTASMILGTAIHDAILEPDTYYDRVVIAPEWGYGPQSKAGKEERAAFGAKHTGKIILSRDDGETVRRCAASVRDHRAASRLLSGGVPETSLFWNDAQYNVPVKARLDYRNRGGIIDLKSTRDASPEEFGRSAAKYGYHRQAANYSSGSEHVLNETPAFYIIVAVETEAPHAVACYQMPPEALQMGARLMDEALARYKQALDSGEWIGYPPTVELLNFPRWALKF